MDEKFMFSHGYPMGLVPLKGPFFSHCSVMVSLYKSSDIVCVGQFLESLLNSIGLFSFP